MLKKHPLLIIEDDPVQQALLERALAHLPYALSITGNAEDALGAFEKIGHGVVICDINLPGPRSGIDVLGDLMNAAEPPVVIMLTADGEADKIIRTMRLGVFDYLLKPVQVADLHQAIERAHSRAETEALRRQVEIERNQRIEQQLATRRITDALVRRQGNKFAKTLFSNIHTSFTQGRGVGSLTTLVSMLAGSPLSSDGTSYVIAKDILEMIFDNQKAVSEMIEVFAELQLLVSQDFALYDVTLGEFHKIISDIIYELRPMSSLGSHRLLLNELPARFFGVRLKLNWEFMRKAMRELLLNAMKFSPHESAITVLVEYLHSRVLITVLNSPLAVNSGDAGGIPEDYRKIIFEPFYRLTRVLREQYQTLEYGLGLTYVEKVVQMHKGGILCTAVDDFSADSLAVGKLVAFEIELPT